MFKPLLKIVNEAILVRTTRSKGVTQKSVLFGEAYSEVRAFWGKVTQKSVLFRGKAYNAVGVLFYNN